MTPWMTVIFKKQPSMLFLFSVKLRPAEKLLFNLGSDLCNQWLHQRKIKKTMHEAFVDAKKRCSRDFRDVFQVWKKNLLFLFDRPQIGWCFTFSCNKKLILFTSKESFWFIVFGRCGIWMMWCIYVAVITDLSQFVQFVQNLVRKSRMDC